MRQKRKAIATFWAQDAIKFILNSPHDTVSIKQRKHRKQKDRPSYRLTEVHSETDIHETLKCMGEPARYRDKTDKKDKGISGSPLVPSPPSPGPYLTLPTRNSALIPSLNVFYSPCSSSFSSSGTVYDHKPLPHSPPPPLSPPLPFIPVIIRLVAH